jgi:ACS family glucarate transporter-like MFS transporter
MLRRIPVRWRVLAVLFVVSFVNYLLRNVLSVAIPSIRAEFGFTTAELGWILASFGLSYTLLQIPGGLFGQRYGTRRALGFLTVAWGVLTWLTGFAPGLMAASAAGAMVALVAVRLLLGATQAPIFPVTAGTVEAWFPPGHWALPNAVTSSGLALGQAALGPVVTALIVYYGWRDACYILAPFGVLVGIWWYWYARDLPVQHPAITAEEIAFIERGRAQARTGADAGGSWRQALLERDVLLLAVSYFCLNYVFFMFSQWLFIYLVESRGFSMLESGWLYALPFISGAVLTVIGGVVCDVLCQRLGPRRGCRVTAMSGLLLVAGFMLAGAFAADPYVAVALLSLCFGFTLFTDTTYWAATTYVAGENTMSATGLMNFGGNLPSLLAPVIGYAIDHVGWIPTIASGSFFALLGAALWLLVRLNGAGGAHP